LCSRTSARIPRPHDSQASCLSFFAHRSSCCVYSLSRLTKNNEQLDPGGEAQTRAVLQLRDSGVRRVAAAVQVAGLGGAT
jgi:hypothetical protein